MLQLQSTHHKSPSIIADIRYTSRELVREFGLMSISVAGTDLSLSAVHAIIEIGNNNDISSSLLGELLHLEKSTISRLVQSLIVRDEIFEKHSSSDGRVKQLHLTKRGLKTLEAINLHSDTRVTEALNNVDQESQINILRGLRDYTAALKHPSTQPRPPTFHHKPDQQSVVIEKGYTPTIIGAVVSLMHWSMHQKFKFDASFESRISIDLANFVSRLNSANNQIWHAKSNHQIVGSISIDGENLGNNNAHLRWFVVDGKIQGSGTGRALLAQALEFCDKSNFLQTHLWTIKGLDAARNLYENQGFQLADEYYGDQWGKKVLEQKFIRPKFSK